MAAPPVNPLLAPSASGPMTGLAPVQAAVDARFTALQNQVAALPTQVQFNAQFNALAAQVAAIQTQLAALNIAASVAAISAGVQAIARARADNMHDKRDIAYTVVPLSTGALPVAWPAGFDRAALVEGPIVRVDALLAEYGLPSGPPQGAAVRRNALALHIGTYRARGVPGV